MPRLTNSLPKYRHHKASGQAVVTIAGRDFYLGPHGTKASKLEYDRLVAEWLAGGRMTHVSPMSGDITVAEVMAGYLRFAKDRYVKNGLPTSEQDGIRAALRPVKELYSKQPASTFGPLALKAVRARMVDSGMSRTTVNQNTGRIVRMFKWAASEELLPAVIPQSLLTVTGLRKGHTAARETAPISPAKDVDIEATLPLLSNIVADMVRLQRLTGMRPGEVCIVRPVDIDRSADVWTYRPESHKTEHHERDRIVYIGPQGQQILASYLLRDGSAYCFSPRERESLRNASRRENRKSPMTPSQAARKPKRNRDRKPGDCYLPNSYRLAIKRACLNANVPVWRPNQLRHTAATEIRRAFGLEGAQVTLGHSAADITQVYAERDATLARRIAGEVG